MIENTAYVNAFHDVMGALGLSSAPARSASLSSSSTPARSVPSSAQSGDALYLANIVLYGIILDELPLAHALESLGPRLDMGLPRRKRLAV